MVRAAQSIIDCLPAYLTAGKTGSAIAPVHSIGVILRVSGVYGKDSLRAASEYRALFQRTIACLRRPSSFPLRFCTRPQLKNAFLSNPC